MRFLYVQTIALWLCLMLIVCTCSGLTQGEVVVTRALEHLGKPYVLGAEGPDAFDCSGLVMYCLIPEGFAFPIHSAALIGTDEAYPLIQSPADLMTGDVVCFDTIQDQDPSDHMGFYLGGGRFVHASSTGEVKISELEDFYLERFTGARRYTRVHTDFPTARQLSEWFAGTWLYEKLAPVRTWFDSLELDKKWAPVREWFDSMLLKERVLTLKGNIQERWKHFFNR